MATISPNAPSNPRVIPVLQAGGGTPSSAAARHTIETFHPSVLSHLNHIFNLLAQGHALDKTQTSHFLKDIQQDPEASARGLEKDSNGFDDFLGYMASPASSALGAPRQHDLSRPISNYFISSSHNTYLTGNQLYGEASTGAYTNVLQRGCRCLEIDVWDGEPKSQDSSDADGDAGLKPHRMAKFSSKVTGRLDKIKARARSGSNPKSEPSQPSPDLMPAPSANLEMPAPWRSPSTELRAEPRVLHGHTLTKEVSFRSVCEVIRNSAFIATDLPIIVSLEVHAGLEQQEIMVEIMREVWKGMLVDITEKSEEHIESLPSPGQLRRKILIKVKWTPTKSGESNNPIEQVASLSSEDERLPEAQKDKKKKATKLLQALSELGVYTRAYSFKHFSQPEAQIPTHVFSLSEQKVIDMHEEQFDSLFNHNRNYLMRAFPSGLRVDSSNVEPLFLWRQGVQMVALNWQSWDKGMMLNEGMFSNEQGWVLKPNGYRGTIGDSTAARPIEYRTLDLTIELFAAQGLPLSSEHKHPTRFHPYVKCQLHVDIRSEKTSSAKDRKDKNDERFKRRSKTGQGVDPDFSGEPMRFSGVTDVIEELSFLR